MVREQGEIHAHPPNSMRADRVPKFWHVMAVRVTPKEAQLHRKRESLTVDWNKGKRHKRYSTELGTQTLLTVPEYPPGSFLGRWSSWTWKDVLGGNVAVVTFGTRKLAEECTSWCMDKELEFVSTRIQGSEPEPQKKALQRIRGLAKGFEE